MDLIVSWFPYYIFIILLLFGTSTEISKLDKVGLNVFLLIFIFTAIRFNVGYDYATYYSIISDATLENSFATERFEFFNVVLINIARFLNFTQLYFIVTSLIMYGLIIITIKRKSISPQISVWVLIGFPLFYMQSLSIIRQWVALAIIFYGIGYLETGKYVRFTILTVLATLWHETAFVAILLIPLSMLNLSRKLNLFILAMSPILYFILPPIIIGLNLDFLLKAQEYIENEVGQGNANTKIIFLATFFGIFNLLFYDKITKGERFPKLLLTYYNVGVMFFVTFQQFGFIGARGGSYFLIFLILLFPYYKNVFYLFKPQLFKGMIQLIMILLFFISLFVSHNDFESKSSLIDPYTPYKIFLGKDENDLNLK